MQTVEEVLNRAKELNDGKQHNKVIELLTNEVLEKYKNADLYAEASMAYYRINKYEASEVMANIGIAINPNHAKAHHYKGNAYDNLKKYDEAITAYKRAIEIDPKFAPAYIGLGNVYLKQKKYDDATRSFKEAIEIDSTFAYAYNGLGNVYSDQKKNDEAVEAFKKALEIDPEFSYAYNGLGNVYTDLKMYILAIQSFKKAIEYDPIADYAYYNLGNSYRDQKKYDEALQAYYKAIEINPTDADPYNGIGNIYLDQKMYEEAIQAYKKAIEINPKLHHAYNGLGCVYLAQKKYDEAIQAYKKAIETDPTDRSPLYNSALLYIELERYQDALVEFKKYIYLNLDKRDELTEYAKTKVTELEELLQTNEYNEVRKLAEDIKEILLHKDGNITHYTGTAIAKKLLLEKDRSLFRLSEGAFLNDSSEGRTLFDFLPTIDATNHRTSSTIMEPFAKRPFIGSFVPNDLHDNLTLWRMYGKEDREEAKGCAITIDGKQLIEHIKNKLQIEGKALSIDDEDFKFYRVAYSLNDLCDKFIIPNALPEDNEKLNKCMCELKDKVRKFIDEKEKEDLKYLLEPLNNIAYLFKNTAYQHECELRLVIKGVQFAKAVDLAFTPPKVYIELVDILPLVRKLTLGPKVDKKDEWASAFYYSITQNLTATDIPPEIYISHLPFK